MSRRRFVATTLDPFDPLGVADSLWLRRLFEQLLGGTLASSLALAGCSGSPTGFIVDSQLAGPPVAGARAPAFAADATQPVGSTPPLAPTCSNMVWSLAPGFRLAMPVDYIADRNRGGDVISSIGTSCTGAVDPAGCAAAARVPFDEDRHLLTTAGDEVRIWPREAANVILGPIDTPAEALWVALVGRYDVPCRASVEASGDTVYISRATRWVCKDGVQTAAAELSVARDGLITELRAVADMSGQCPMAGRRPQGLRSRCAPLGASVLGDHFAAMAHMEAASVPAFAALARELALYRAPSALIAAAEQARTDEIRHARLTGQLAREFGGRPARPRVQAMPARSLYAFALDNAVEGCIHETYAALSASHAAMTARHPVVQSVMAGVARDEIRHAGLAFQIARWVRPLLSAEQAARIESAQCRAVEQLGASLGRPVPRQLCELAGVEPPRTARALHGELASTLWRNASAESCG